MQLDYAKRDKVEICGDETQLTLLLFNVSFLLLLVTIDFGNSLVLLFCFCKREVLQRRERSNKGYEAKKG